TLCPLRSGCDSPGPGRLPASCLLSAPPGAPPLLLSHRRVPSQIRRSAHRRIRHAPPSKCARRTAPPSHQPPGLRGKPETHRTDLFARRGGAERGEYIPVQLDHPASDQTPPPPTAADPPPAFRFAALPGVFRPLSSGPWPGRSRELVFRRWLGGPGTGVLSPPGPN